MLLLVELGLTIYGIVIVVRGTHKVGKDSKVTGMPARVIGLVFVGTLPLAVLVGFTAGLAYALVQGKPPQGATLFFFALADVAAIMAVFAVTMILGAKYKEPLVPLAVEEDSFAPTAFSVNVDIPEIRDPNNPYASPESYDHRR